MEDTDKELVKDSFNIDKEDLEEKSEESDYWDSCLQFYLQVMDKDVSRLSSKQVNWLEKIESDLRNRIKN